MPVSEFAGRFQSIAPYKKERKKEKRKLSFPIRKKEKDKENDINR